MTPPLPVARRSPSGAPGLAVLVALALDRAVPEPPPAAHPVVWMGRYLEAAGRPLLRVRAPGAQLGAGAAAWALGAAAALAGGVAADRAVARLPRAARPLAAGVALWPLLALQGLLVEVGAVEAALARSLPAGRAQVARIVSRPVAALAEDEVRAAALESLAENLSDSLVAPLCCYAAGGLPAAAVYRFANTADAMWGYREPWGRRGATAARADDAVNLLPARLTGLALAGHRVRPARLRAQAALTPSPNSGWPMAALALRLGVRLAKPGAYVLNPAGRAPASGDTARALRLVAARGWLLAAALAVAAAARDAGRGRRGTGRA